MILREYWEECKPPSTTTTSTESSPVSRERASTNSSLKELPRSEVHPLADKPAKAKKRKLPLPRTPKKKNPKRNNNPRKRSKLPRKKKKISDSVEDSSTDHSPYLN